jgi:hypothetical protein
VIAIKMSEQELHGHWDRIEAVLGEYGTESPWYGRPSDYLLAAHKQGLITWDQALEMHMVATGIATTDP